MTKISRRRFLKKTATTGAIATTALTAPTILMAKKRSIKVGTYGGFFEESFTKFIYPEFTAATGIEVSSISIPTSATWLAQLKNAARAKKALADVTLIDGINRLRGAKQNMFQVIDESKIPNSKNLPDHFLARYDDKSLYGCGALSWYITLCSNTKKITKEPKSWAELWNPKNKNSLGLLAQATNSYLLEITATTYFNGTDILNTKDGIKKVFAKLSEVLPNVRLWYKDEGSFQQALQDGEIPMGQYYHDVAGLAAAEGFPVRSTFPIEGGVLDSGFWVMPKHAKPVDEAHEFINYMSQPAVQASLSRNVGTAPVINPSLTDLEPDELAAVSSDKTPIIPRYDIYMQHEQFIEDRWSKLISGAK